MAWFGIYAGVTAHSTSVPSYGRAVGASWMEQSRSRATKGAKMKDNPEDVPMVYVLYVLIGILASAAGAALFIVRLF
jgi:hypothetical protein